MKKTKVQKVAKALGKNVESFSDGSLSWVVIENKDYAVTICFDGIDGDFEHITLSKKKWEVVSEDTISTLK